MQSLSRALLTVLLLASATPAMAAQSPVSNALLARGQNPLVHSVQYDTDPCTDGRYNDGKPRSCREFLRTLERRDRYRERWERYVPCTDGRVSDGRPRSCQEIRRWYRERQDDDDWRPRQQWK